MCLIAQLILLKAVDTQFLTNDPTQPDYSQKDKIEQCFVFLPTAIFFIAADVQILIETYKYKPVAFSKMPFRFTHKFMIMLAYFSLLITILSYIFCIIVFGAINPSPALRKWCFTLFIIKAIAWSPFVGLEYYDMCFEHLYHDV